MGVDFYNFNMKKKLILDPTAPRFRSDSTTIATAPFFSKFFKENPQFKPFKKQFTLAQLKEMIKFVNVDLRTAAIETRDGVLLPKSLGWIYLGTILTPKKVVNHKLSNELERDINFTNNHSDGKMLKIIHTAGHRSFKFENKDLWKFTAGADFRDHASKEFSKRYMVYCPVVSNRDREQREKAFYKIENSKQNG